MLWFEGYGIRLKRLEFQDIELVRYWRNSDHIKRFMEYREEITPQMQIHWFNSINNNKNYFFLISVNNDFIGLINGSQTDWEKGETGNGGIFVWEESYWSTSIPFAAALLLTEFSLNLGIRTCYAKILSNNFRSIHFNKALGYRLLPGQENVLNQKYALTSQDFFSETVEARRILKKEFGEKLILRVSGVPDEPERFLLQQFDECRSHFVSPIELVVE